MVGLQPPALHGNIYPRSLMCSHGWSPPTADSVIRTFAPSCIFFQCLSTLRVLIRALLFEEQSNVSHGRVECRGTNLIRIYKHSRLAAAAPVVSIVSCLDCATRGIPQPPPTQQHETTIFVVFPDSCCFGVHRHAYLVVCNTVKQHQVLTMQ